MKEFINTDDKSGPKIKDSLAELVNEGLRKKPNEERVKELVKKYEKPENVKSLMVPRVNNGWYYYYCTFVCNYVQVILTLEFGPVCSVNNSQMFT